MPTALLTTITTRPQPDFVLWAGVPSSDQDGVLLTLQILTAALVLVLGALLFRSRRRKVGLERELEASRQRFEGLSGSTGLMRFETDRTGSLTRVDPNLVTLTGLDAETLLARVDGLQELVHPEDRNAFLAEEDGTSAEPGQRLLTYRLRGSDRIWHWIEERRTPQVREGVLLGHESIAWDVSDRHRFEIQQKRLLDLERLSTTFLESFLVTDDIGSTTARMLDALGRYFDFTGAMVLERRDDEDAFHLAHDWRCASSDAPVRSAEPLEAERIAWWIEQVRGGIPFTLTRDTVAIGEESAVKALSDAETVLVVPILVMGRLRMLLVLEDRDQQRTWQPEELACIQTMAHAVARSLERSLAEQERGEFAEYRRLIERTEAVGQLASGIAHDFNNIIFAISGRIQLLQRQTEDERVLDGLQSIEGAIGNAKDLINTLRVMNDKGDRTTGSVRIVTETRRVTEMIGRLLPHTVELELELNLPAETDALCPPDALHQVVSNLIVNARDAVEGRGRIRVGLHEVPDDDHPIRIEVEDDGPGIPEELRPEMLKPFVSSKASTHGSGLGLSIVRRVLEKCMGTLELGDSALGGLRVRIGLRRSKPVGDDTGEVTAQSAPETRPRKACVVEDDPVIRDLICQYLRSEGTETVDLPDALGVSALLDEPGHGIDLLIMDIDLPRMTGIECLESLRRRGHATPCVLMTAGLQDPPAGLEDMLILRKPFPMNSLGATCIALLEDHVRSDRNASDQS